MIDLNNKRQAAEILAEANKLQSIKEVAVDGLIRTLESAMSTLATISPETALDVIDSFLEYQPAIEDAIRYNKLKGDAAVDKIEKDLISQG